MTSLTMFASGSFSLCSLYLVSEAFEDMPEKASTLLDETIPEL
ncbi:hypothetical protein [Streptomyces sp. cg40]